MSLFKRKLKLSLIDLAEYREQLLDNKRDGYPNDSLQPVPTIPGRRLGVWSDEEMALMRENRYLANLIYEDIKSL